MRPNLILWEKRNGYTGRYVAGRLGISESAWCKIKQGKQTPTLRQAEALHREFCIDDVFELLREVK